MHAIPLLIQSLAAPLFALTHSIATVAAPVARQYPALVDQAGPAFFISAALIGAVCCYWAAWSHARFNNQRIAMDKELSVARLAVGFRDAVLGTLDTSIVILDTDARCPVSFGAGSTLLDAALAGIDAPILAAAMDRLLKNTEPFSISVRTDDMGRIAVRAVPVMGRCVMVLALGDAFAKPIDYRAILDLLPMPVWVRDTKLNLVWANPAFVSAVGATTSQQALSKNATLGSFEHDLASAARDGGDIVDARRYTLVHGKRHALNINLSRLPDASVAGFALDVSDFSLAEAKLQIGADANADMLDQISIGIAVFDENQRLVSHNKRYSRLWSLDDQWLDTKPTQSEILDRLRETRRLPEQHDFARWKQEYLDLFESDGSRTEQLWHLSDGQSLRMTAKPHLQGGLFFTFEDVSERFRLKASVGTLEAVQNAILETVDDGVAIFGPGGQLLANNELFAKAWSFSKEELSDKPHFSKLAALSAARLGRDGVWDIVSSAVTSSNPERFNEWGKVTRADRRTILLTLKRLPDGATLIAFRDITDIERFDASSHDVNHHAA